MVETSSRKVKIILGDGEFVEIDREATQYIGLIRERVQSSDNENEFWVGSIGGDLRKPIVEKIVIFCEHLQAGNQFPVLQKPLTCNDMY